MPAQRPCLEAAFSLSVWRKYARVALEKTQKTGNFYDLVLFSTKPMNLLGAGDDTVITASLAAYLAKPPRRNLTNAYCEEKSE